MTEAWRQETTEGRAQETTDGWRQETTEGWRQETTNYGRSEPVKIKMVNASQSLTDWSGRDAWRAIDGNNNSYFNG